MMYIYNKGEIQKYVYIVIHRYTLLWWLKGLCVLSVLLSLDSRWISISLVIKFSLKIVMGNG